MSDYFNAIEPGNTRNSPPLTIGPAAIINPTNIQAARGLFLVTITDVLAISTIQVVIYGGLSRKFGSPNNIYTALGGSQLNSNVTINNPGAQGPSGGQTTIVITDATTGTQFDLVYDAYTTGSTLMPTIQNTGGPVPLGNTTVTTIYLNPLIRAP